MIASLFQENLSQSLQKNNWQEPFWKDHKKTIRLLLQTSSDKEMWKKANTKTYQEANTKTYKEADKETYQKANKETYQEANKETKKMQQSSTQKNNENCYQRFDKGLLHLQETIPIQCS